MRRFRWLFVAFSLFLVIPSGAQAKGANACRHASKAAGVKIMARNGKAVVFRRKSLNVYGCTYRVHKVRRLDTCCTDIKYKVAGVYAGYAASGSAIGDESSKVGVFDLRTGKQRIGEVETEGFVTAWRLAASGGIAWIQSNHHPNTGEDPGPGEYGPDQDLRAAVVRHPAPRVVDTGSTDNMGGGLAKLGLKSGVLTWTNAGEKKTAKLDGSQ